MADGIESFDAMKNMKRVASGFKGSKFFQSMQLTPPRTFVEGWPPEVSQNFQDREMAHPKPENPWYSRR